MPVLYILQVVQPDEENRIVLPALDISTNVACIKISPQSSGSFTLAEIYMESCYECKSFDQIVKLINLLNKLVRNMN